MLKRRWLVLLLVLLICIQKIPSQDSEENHGCKKYLIEWIGIKNLYQQVKDQLDQIHYLGSQNQVKFVVLTLLTDLIIVNY